MKKLLLILSLLVTVQISYSQLGYLAANGINTNGTYADLGSNGTVIATAGFDDDNSAAQNIGFNFTFNSTVFTQFVLNTNGVIKLGSIAPLDVRLYDALASAETNLVYPLSLDLVRGTAPEYRVYTSGVAPNRICTIQFKNVSDYFTTPATAPQFSDMDFQIRLYETTNAIEFVYGNFVAGGATSASTVAKVGLKGVAAENSVNVTKGSASAWSSATFIDGNYTGNAHNIRNTVLPAPGKTYRFRADASLPIKLSGFSGNIRNNTTFLSWITNYENNNDRFEVERSLAGSANWVKIGAVIATGNSTAINKYQFTDHGIDNGKWMYRLKIFDKDGRFTYSPIVILQLTGKLLFLLGQNYPNPVTGTTMIPYELGKDASVTIELYSLDGKKIMALQKGKQIKGAYNFPLNIVSLALPSGKYIYRMVVQDNATGEINVVKKEMNVMR